MHPAFYPATVLAALVLSAALLAVLLQGPSGAVTQRFRRILLVTMITLGLAFAVAPIMGLLWPDFAGPVMVGVLTAVVQFIVATYSRLTDADTGQVS